MNRELLQDIFDYISYLQNILLHISFIDKHYHFLRRFPSLIAYNSHNTPYCSLVKSSAPMQQKCDCRQYLVHSACKNGPIFGACWAGVYEYVLPILYNGTPVSYICVSGYGILTDKTYRHLRHIAQRYGIPQTALAADYAKLKTDIPDQNYVLKLVQPLCRMFELLYLNLNKESRSTPPRNTMSHKILDYLYKHYTEDISLEQIAATCHYSASYVRHIFKKETGYTISHYLNILKITKAKELLTTTVLPVSEISLRVGFNDPNYFSNTFHKETSLSPKQWRTRYSAK